MKSPVFFTAVVLGLLLSSTTKSLAQFTLSGKISASDGSPIQGATLVLTFKPSSTALVATAMADSSGNFEVKGLPIGDYSWEVKAERYDSQNGWFDQREGTKRLEIVLQPNPASPADSSTVLLSDGRFANVTGIDVTVSTQESRNRLESYVIPLPLGMSFTVICEHKRPFQNLSTEAILLKFKEARDAYKAEDRRAEFTAESLISALRSKGDLPKGLEKKLKEYDKSYDTDFAEVDATGKKIHPNWPTERLVQALEVELNTYSHYLNTMRLLRDSVGELGRRNAFALPESIEYAAFLYRGEDLVGKEVEFPLVGTPPPNPSVLRDVQTLITAAKGLSSSTRLVINKYGVAIGFLEAAPADEEVQLRFPAKITVTRRFTPVPSGSIGDAKAIYKIRMWVDWSKDQHPKGVTGQDESPEVQTIAQNDRTV